MNQTNHRYDAIIIGLAKAEKNLAAALGGAEKRTALIEKSSEMYGGTYINVGCIPTKFLVHKAQEARLATSAAERQALYAKAVGQKNGLTGRLRSKNLQKAEGVPNVTVLTGTAKLRSAHQVEVRTESGSEFLEGEQNFLNTGSVPVIPPIPGLKENPYV